ncbi:helicase domain protein [Nitzschia inconspicua]|uniref:Helicase domain protein n=1 Tax=Nitzschia inconspicua TaxID=303405 RepID=A0A9K3PPH5_9STRA|nr:helicase domain protein [Nitzschia inconspicua]
MTLSDITGVEAIQQHLETLAAKHRTRGSRKNFLQARHIKEEFLTRRNVGEEKIDDDTADLLFDEFARVVCKANAIPRKELFEAWAMALYVHNHFSTAESRRIADLACGHGLLSWALMYLDDQSHRLNASSEPSCQPRTAICIDLKMPMSVEKLETAMTEQWPIFEGRWNYVEGALERIVSSPSTLLVGIHCCAALSDKVIDLAVAANAPLALVPCCHTRKCLSQEQNMNLKALLEDQGMTLAEFIDGNRIQRLKDAGYTVTEERIPQVITPKNRIILANPPSKTVAQEAAPLLTELIYSTSLLKFTIPVGDSIQARSEIEVLSGREAANRRRRKLPPHLSVSIILPHPDAVTIPDIERLSSAVAEEYKLVNNGELVDAVIITSVEQVGKLHARTDGRYCRTFRITFQVMDETGKVPEVTKKQAKEMTLMICKLIDTSFGDDVMVRQVPGEKDVRKEHLKRQFLNESRSPVDSNATRANVFLFSCNPSSRHKGLREATVINWKHSQIHVLVFALLLLVVSVSCTRVVALQTARLHFLYPVQLSVETSLTAKKHPKRKSSSLASQSFQDSRRVQRILRNRSTRGRPQLSSEEPPDGNRFTIQSPERTDSKIAQAQIRKKLGKLSPSIRSSEPQIRKDSEPDVDVSNGIDFPYELTFQALQSYYKENQDLCLPRRFLVPESDAYPSIWHGLDLARTVYNMKWWQTHVKQRPDRVSQLNQIGFLWERLQPEWNLILEALIVYRGMYGDLIVPSNFTVPFKDPDWPKACWGIALGSVVFKIRNRSDHLRDVHTAWKRREQLDRIGFVWDVQELRFNKLCTALKLYAKIEQNNEVTLERKLQKVGSASPQLFALKIPTKFVVPRSSRWPNEFWGYRLGERCTQVRQKQLYVKGHPDRLKVLADLGFYISSGNDSLKWLQVVHAAALYSQMHNNRLDVPTKYVVPAPRKLKRGQVVNEDSVPMVEYSNELFRDDAWPWPEYLWGFPLGQRLRDIRVKGYFLRGDQAAIRRQQLDALGFNWDPPRGRPRKQNVSR